MFVYCILSHMSMKLDQSEVGVATESEQQGGGVVEDEEERQLAMVSGRRVVWEARCPYTGLPSHYRFVFKVTKIRKMLTEILLEVTSTEVQLVAAETLEEFRSKGLYSRSEIQVEGSFFVLHPEPKLPIVAHLVGQKLQPGKEGLLGKLSFTQCVLCVVCLFVRVFLHGVCVFCMVCVCVCVCVHVCVCSRVCVFCMMWCVCAIYVR